MKKSYVLIYGNAPHSGSFLARAAIREWANKSPLVETWRTELPNCFYLVSEASANDLAIDLRNNVRTLRNFLIIEASENRQGWLSKETWYLLRHKKQKP